MLRSFERVGDGVKVAIGGEYIFLSKLEIGTCSMKPWRKHSDPELTSTSCQFGPLKFAFFAFQTTRNAKWLPERRSSWRLSFLAIAGAFSTLRDRVADTLATTLHTLGLILYFEIASVGKTSLMNQYVNKKVIVAVARFGHYRCYCFYLCYQTFCFSSS